MEDLITYGPPEVIMSLLLQMDLQTLTRMCSTNRQIRVICKDNHFQKRYFETHSADIVRQLFKIARKRYQEVTKSDLDFFKKWYRMIGTKEYDSYLLSEAAINDHYQLVKLLLKNPKIDPAYYDNGAIRFAAQYGGPRTVNLLLKDPRVDPSALGNWAIIKAAPQDYRTKIVRHLLRDERVDPTVYNHYAIKEASKNDQTKTVDLLKRWYREHDIMIPDL